MSNREKLWHRIRKASRQALLAAALSALIPLVSLYWLIGRREPEDLQRIASYRAGFEDHFDEFLTDAEFIRETGVFREYGNLHDAGVFLNPRLRWQKPDGRYNEYQDASEPDRAIAIPVALKQRLDEWEDGEWTTHLEEIASSDVDTSWIGDLEPYDHWEWYRNSLTDTLIRDDPNLRALSFPHPESSALLIHARIHLARAAIQNDLERAIVQLRHLAHLTQSTETLVGTMVALGIFGFEADLHATLAELGDLPAFDWLVFDKNERLRLRRYVWSLDDLVSIFAPPEAITRVTDLNVPGLCISLSKGIDDAAFSRVLFAPHFPLEDDYRPNYAVLDAAMEATEGRCRLTHVRARWQQAAKDPRSIRWIDLIGRSWLPSTVELPYIRRRTGVSAFAPYKRPFRMYEN